MCGYNPELCPLVCRLCKRKKRDHDLHEQPTPTHTHETGNHPQQLLSLGEAGHPQGRLSLQEAGRLVDLETTSLHETSSFTHSETPPQPPEPEAVPLQNIPSLPASPSNLRERAWLCAFTSSCTPSCTSLPTTSCSHSPPPASPTLSSPQLSLPPRPESKRGCNEQTPAAVVDRIFVRPRCSHYDNLPRVEQDRDIGLGRVPSCAGGRPCCHSPLRRSSLQDKNHYQHVTVASPFPTTQPHYPQAACQMSRPCGCWIPCKCSQTTRPLQHHWSKVPQRHHSLSQRLSCPGNCERVPGSAPQSGSTSDSALEVGGDQPRSSISSPTCAQHCGHISMQPPPLSSQANILACTPYEEHPFPPSRSTGMLCDCTNNHRHTPDNDKDIHTQ